MSERVLSAGQRNRAVLARQRFLGREPASSGRLGGAIKPEASG